MKVYERDKYNLENGYTDEASNLDNEIRKIMKPIIQREIIEKGVPAEYFMYIVYDAVHMEVIRQRVHRRIELSKKNEENNIKGVDVDETEQTS